MARPKNEVFDDADTESAAPAQATGTRRVYRNSIEVDHDLYKLKLGVMKKNVSFHTHQLELESVEHVHFFHSVDSSGESQSECSPVGNHVHAMTLLPGKAGEAPVVVCGPASRVVRDARGARILEPITYDSHTHEVEYMRSEKIPVREINAEFVKFSSMVEAQRPATVPGIK